MEFRDRRPDLYRALVKAASQGLTAQAPHISIPKKLDFLQRQNVTESDVQVEVSTLGQNIF